MAMFCTNCGEEMRATDKFCAGCGTPAAPRSAKPRDHRLRCVGASSICAARSRYSGGPGSSFQSAGAAGFVGSRRDRVGTRHVARRRFAAGVPAGDTGGPNANMRILSPAESGGQPILRAVRSTAASRACGSGRTGPASPFSSTGSSTGAHNPIGLARRACACTLRRGSACESDCGCESSDRSRTADCRCDWKRRLRLFLLL